MSIPISEIYGPVIQGEGNVIGTPTVFVRTGGCDFHCSWCDSLYAVDKKRFGHTWTHMAPSDIMDQVEALAPKPVMVTLSGGNPAIHPDVEALIDLGHDRGYHFAIETQGTYFPRWAPLLDWVTLSPKPPSSGMKFDQRALERWLEMCEGDIANPALKVVVFDEADYEFAGRIRALGLEYHVPTYLQVGTSNPYSQTDTYEARSVFREAILERTDWLSQRVITDRWYDVRVLPQMHALIYGAKRGV